MKKQVTFFICTIILLALSSCHKEADYSLNNSIWIHQFQAEERVEGGVKAVGLFFGAKTIEKYSLDKDYKALKLLNTFNYVKEGNEIIINGAFRQTVGDNYLTLVMECTIVQKKARALFSKSNKKGGSN